MFHRRVALICAVLLGAATLALAAGLSCARAQRTLGANDRPALVPRVEVVASGLAIPWALAFAPDGRLFLTERPGRVRVVVNGRLLPDPVATFPVAAAPGRESGLMGLALDPDFRDNGFLYVMYTYRNDGGPLANRISRLTVQGNTASGETVLLDGIPGGAIHDGGRLKFGPAGKLFATTGDSGDSSLAQDRNSLAGKILRLNPDGSIPDDNPFPGSLIYTLGHRNAEGLAFQPATGQLFETEHGNVGNDELNAIDAGRNYGWPIVEGDPGDPRFVDPLQVYHPSIAPSGATFYDAAVLSAWTGSLFFATLGGEHLHRVVLGGSGGRQILSEERLFAGQFGRLRDVAQGPDGFLYFCTSNRDGRGRPGPADDRILRIVPQ